LILPFLFFSCRSGQAIKWLRFQGSDVPLGYEEAFQRAVLTFKHQRVFDPVSQEAVHLTEPPRGNDIPEDLNFVGPAIAAHVAQAIATGQICPVTYEPFEVGLARGQSGLQVYLKDVFHCELSVQDFRMVNFLTSRHSSAPHIWSLRHLNLWIGS
jgi:hypothetical protein